MNTETNDSTAELPPLVEEPDHTGLYDKFIVQRVDGRDKPGQKHHNSEYFVLDLTHDKHAGAALRAYAQSCAYARPQLAADLLARVDKFYKEQA